jgi:hypothetical protein
MNTRELESGCENMGVIDRTGHYCVHESLNHCAHYELHVLLEKDLSASDCRIISYVAKDYHDINDIECMIAKSNGRREPGFVDACSEENVRALCLEKGNYMHFDAKGSSARYAKEVVESVLEYLEVERFFD